jgi:hypothetical protein
MLLGRTVIEMLSFITMTVHLGSISGLVQSYDPNSDQMVQWLISLLWIQYETLALNYATLVCGCGIIIKWSIRFHRG